MEQSMCACVSNYCLHQSCHAFSCYHSSQQMWNGNSSLEQPCCDSRSVFVRKAGIQLWYLLNVTTGSRNKKVNIPVRGRGRFNWSYTPQTHTSVEGRTCTFSKYSHAFNLKSSSSLLLCTTQIYRSVFLLFILFSISFLRSSFTVHNGAAASKSLG